MLSGKLHFGYIYGFSIVGCLMIYMILNLMSDSGISIDRTSSILGYSLLPIVKLAAFNVFFNLQGYLGIVLAVVCIGWCTITATRFVEVALNMRKQRYLVAYPVALLYACFALLTIFWCFSIPLIIFFMKNVMRLYVNNYATGSEGPSNGSNWRPQPYSQGSCLNLSIYWYASFNSVNVETKCI